MQPCQHSRSRRAPARILAGLGIIALACADTGTAPPDTGFIDVSVSTTGETLDSNGYRLAFSGQTVQIKAVGINGTLALQLEEGVHQVELLDVAANCVVAGENPRAVTVMEGETARVSFEVTCAFVLREIAFSRDRDPASQDCTGWSWTCNDLYIMGANGVAEARLTNSSEHDDTQPAWSPDGRIAFVRSSDLAAEGIHVIDADGSGLTQLTQWALDSDPTWSPDGNRIAFIRARDDDEHRRAIYVMNADGSHLQELLGGPGDHGDPAWSPDGSRIAFSSYDDDGGLWQSDIYIMNADGSDPVRLTADPGDDLNPAWSPDGSRIVFASRRGEDEDLDIYVIDADGASPPLRLHGGPGDDHDPTWSPDGSRIAFSKQVDDDLYDSDVYVMAADGSDLVNITDRPGYDGSPSWKPGTPTASTRPHAPSSDVAR